MFVCTSTTKPASGQEGLCLIMFLVGRKIQKGLRLLSCFTFCKPKRRDHEEQNKAFDSAKKPSKQRSKGTKEERNRQRLYNRCLHSKQGCLAVLTKFIAHHVFPCDDAPDMIVLILGTQQTTSRLCCVWCLVCVCVCVRKCAYMIVLILCGQQTISK